MSYILCSFILGCLIPYSARRFSKFMPATSAYAFYRLLKPVKTSAKRNKKFQLLKSRYYWRSLMFGLFLSFMSYFAILKFGSYHISWYLFFIFMLTLLAEVDLKTGLLPDILTIPLLLFGFAYAVFVSGWVGPAASVIGSLIGYFLPIFASLFFISKNKDIFGGGDIKLLCAIGAWFGIDPLLYTIILACVLFSIWALFARKRQGPFGPALSISAIIVAFYFL